MNRTQELQKKPFNVKDFLSKYVLELILIIMVVVMSFASEFFLTPGNFLNIIRNISIQGIVAFGMTMVLICGEIDLSVPSTSALSGVVAAIVCGKMSEATGISMDYTIWFGLLAAFGIAICMGLFNGFFITKYKMPSFIVTMASMNIMYGICAVVSDGFPVITLPTWFGVLGAGDVFGFPIPALFLIGTFLLVNFVMNRTKFGRAVYASGGNAEAARLSGINVNRTKMTVMVVIQVAACLSGVLLSSRVMSGSFTFSKGLEMTAISASVIGGTSFSGGSGKVWGTFIGIAFLGILVNAMTLMNVNEFVQYIVRGGLILAAVLLNTIQMSKKI